MDVSELKIEKEKLQNSISSLIENEITDFTNRTGVHVDKIIVTIYDEHFLSGQIIPVEFDVDVKLDI